MKGKIIFSLMVLGILCYGFYRMVFENEYNRCEMTYMFELPRYHKVSLDSRIEKKFPNYALYFYGEGEYYRKYKNLNNLDGIPILFITGNAGSYKEVRSLASVALRMAESSGKRHHFNYFSLDLNEDLSAFYGEYIQLQTQFAISCISAIRSKYKTPPPVILVGHSMGGIVVRNLFHSPGFKAGWVHTIITLASPHVRPVLNVDVAMRAIYDRIDLMWRRPDRRSLANITLVSLTGGSRDIQVRDGLGDITALAAVKSRSLWLTTSSMYRAWASTDHHCAVWCKQVVMNINKALFAMIDARTNQITTNADKRMTIFRRHFEVDISKRGSIENKKEDTTLDSSSANWIYKESPRRFTFQREEIKSPIYIKFGPFYKEEKFQSVLVVNEVRGPWLFLCRSSVLRDPCASVVDVSEWGRTAPPQEFNRKILHLNQKLFANFDEPVYLIVQLMTMKKEVEVFYERYNALTRRISHSPGFTDYFAALPILSDMNRMMLIPETHEEAIYYRISLPGLYHVRQGLEVKVRVLSCSATAGSVGLISLYSPWDRQYVHSSLWYWSNASLNLQLATSRPENDEQTAFVELILDPTCQYRVSVHHSLGAMASQFLAVYMPIVPAYVLVHLLGGLGMQLFSAARGEHVQSIIDVKTKVPLILPSLMIGFILNSAPLSRFSIPTTDVIALQREGLWFPLAMQILFIVSIAIFVLLFLTCKMLVSLLALPLCNQGARLPCRIIAHLIGLMCALSVIYAGTKVCGGIAAAILFLGQLILTAMDKASKDNQHGDGADLYEIRFSVLILLELLLLSSSPSMAVWLKLLKDNSFKKMPTAIGLGSVFILVSFAFLSLARSSPGVWSRLPYLTRGAATIIMVTAVASPLFFSLAFHRLQWGIAVALSAMGIAALIAKAFGRLWRVKTEKTE